RLERLLEPVAGVGVGVVVVDLSVADGAEELESSRLVGAGVETEDAIARLASGIFKTGDETTGDALVPDRRRHIETLQLRCLVRKSLDPATPGGLVIGIGDE